MWTQCSAKTGEHIFVPRGAASAKSIPMRATAAIAVEDDFFVLSSLPPSRAQKRLALAVVLAMFVTFFIVQGPPSRIQLGHFPAFIPAYTMAIVLSNMITTVLLFSQFSIFRTRALLIISSGYLFTALMPVPFMLMFPGVFVPEVLIGGLQSRAYMYFFWHAGFPIFVIAYALSKDADPGKRHWHGTAGSAIALSVALTAAIVSALAIFFTIEHSILPRMERDPLFFSSLWLYFAAPMSALIILALLVLWIRRRSILDLWLMVVMCAYQIEIGLSYFPGGGVYSFGWYVARVFGLLSSSLVLLVLLYEITTLYVRLLLAVRAQRHEREARLITGDAVAASIAHEVKQPLSAMITRAETGLRWLGRSMPDLDKAKAQFEQIAADGYRAGAVIESIRANFKKDTRIRSLLDVNDLIRDTFALVRGDLQQHQILVQVEPNVELPQVKGDRIQLQQVLLNLITNAIDSMASMDGHRVLTVKSGVRDDGGVVVSVADSGTGIGPQDIERVFDPLFTTKSGGMGMGLSICRSIIEAHDGQLFVVPNNPSGTIFQFVLGSSQ
jgi:signal transduction histidine kinase